MTITLTKDQVRLLGDVVENALDQSDDNQELSELLEIIDNAEEAGV